MQILGATSCIVYNGEDSIVCFITKWMQWLLLIKMIRFYQIKGQIFLIIM